MSAGRPRVFTIPAGVPFLPTLAEALLDGRLVPGFSHGGDPLALAGATIYLPTRRAARGLRAVFVELLGGRSAILPTIRALGEVDEDGDIFEEGDGGSLEIDPAIPGIERTLMLAPLVQAWKRRLPAHVAATIGEKVVVPASTADAIWLSRDLAALMDEVETQGADWSALARLVPEDLAGWWQVTLEFLDIMGKHWPRHLSEAGFSNPAAHRDRALRAEAERLRRAPAAGPVVAAGSTGTIPATAELLSVISRLPSGALVLPGLDIELDEASWNAVGRADVSPASFGHPQTALKRLVERLGVGRGEVETLGTPKPELAARAALVAEALRPAGTTDMWAGRRADRTAAVAAGALSGVTLVEAANEREEALAIAAALRMAVDEGGRTAALVTADRDLARRVSAELERFGLLADDSAGSPLASAPGARLMEFLIQAALRPGDPLALHALLDHPMLRLGLERARVRRGVETVELVALRGGTGRPDVATLEAGFAERLAAVEKSTRPPFWRARLSSERLREARAMLAALDRAVTPLRDLRGLAAIDVPTATRATVEALEALGRGEDGGLADLYGGEDGAALAAFLRDLLVSGSGLEFQPGEWPDVAAALIAGRAFRPPPWGDGRVAIWGALEARLQRVDTLVLGGLNEGSWPRRQQADRFMSRLMKTELALEPPERRIGQSAHDFVMAMGAENIVLTRSARAGDAPAVASRWLQRLTACVEGAEADAMRARGRELLTWARDLDRLPDAPAAPRPCPKPPLASRPTRFSVTEIETLRRDPYAVHARRVLGLEPLEPLLRDPGAAERGNLFHDIVHAFAESGIDPHADEAEARLVEIGRRCFDEEALPRDVEAVWWPRFACMAGEFVKWERRRPAGIIRRHAELSADATEVGATGCTLRGRADRIDARPAGMADILDFKTGHSPSKGQAHTLLAPQLALEGALLSRGAFATLGPMTPAELAYVRLAADGRVNEESILEYNRRPRSAPDLSDEAWQRLEGLLAYYRDEANGFLSRALPFRANDASGDYDHLARVLEWSAGGGEEEGA